jgi:hypothetical protein
MAVYYATTQQRTLGRLLKAKDVRIWIRGGNRHAQMNRIIPSFDDILKRLPPSNTPRDFLQNFLQAHLLAWAPNSRLLPILLQLLIPKLEVPDLSSSDPNDYAPNLSEFTRRDIKSDVIYHCFIPSVASVITISAPQMMLTSSLTMLLIALAIYFGFVWTRNLDLAAGHNDSRNVFITYLVGLVVAWLVYTISQLFQNDDKRSERQIAEEYLDEYLANNREALARWGIDIQHVENSIPLTEMARDGRGQRAEGSTFVTAVV